MFVSVFMFGSLEDLRSLKGWMWVLEVILKLGCGRQQRFSSLTSESHCNLTPYYHSPLILTLLILAKSNESNAVGPNGRVRAVTGPQFTDDVLHHFLDRFRADM